MVGEGPIDVLAIIALGIVGHDQGLPFIRTQSAAPVGAGTGRRDIDESLPVAGPVFGIVSADDPPGRMGIIAAPPGGAEKLVVLIRRRRLEFHDVGAGAQGDGRIGRQGIPAPGEATALSRIARAGPHGGALVNGMIAAARAIGEDLADIPLEVVMDHEPITNAGRHRPQCYQSDGGEDCRRALRTTDGAQW